MNRRSPTQQNVCAFPDSRFGKYKGPVVGVSRSVGASKEAGVVRAKSPERRLERPWGGSPRTSQALDYLAKLPVEGTGGNPAWTEQNPFGCWLNSSQGRSQVQLDPGETQSELQDGVRLSWPQKSGQASGGSDMR